MRLLYCYVEFYDRKGNTRPFHGLKNIELNLSTTYVYRYEKATNTLFCSSRETPLPEQFWANGSIPTNIYNINVIAGKNGTGKSTVTHYMIDLLNYIYHNSGKTLTMQDRIIRYNPEVNHNILIIDTDNGIRIIDILPGGKYSNESHFEGFPKPPQFLNRRNVALSLRKTKIINMTNTLTQRDFQLHIESQNERLRDSFIYDCTIGATIGSDVGHYFPYEVYKQVSYIFDSTQNNTLQKMYSTFPEMPRPSTLRLHPLTEQFDQIHFNEVKLREYSLSVQLAVLCAVSFKETLLRNGQLTHANYDSLPLLILPEITLPEYIFENALFEYIDRLSEWAAERVSTRIIIGSEAGDLDVLDVTNGDLKTINRHSRPITSLNRLSNGMVACGLNNGNIQIWNLDEEECIYSYTKFSLSPITYITELSNGSIACGNESGVIFIWDPDLKKTPNVFGIHSESISYIAELPDSLIVSSSKNGSTIIWDPNSYGIIRNTSMQHTSIIIDSLTCVIVLQNGRIVGSRWGEICVWDKEKGQMQTCITGLVALISYLCELPDGFVVGATKSGDLYVFDIDRGECLNVLKTNDNIAFITAISSRLVVCGYESGGIKVWDINQNEFVYGLRKRSPWITCATSVNLHISDKRTRIIWDEQSSIYRDYIHYVLSNNSFFSQFRQDTNDKSTYELSLVSENGIPDRSIEKNLVDFLQLYNKMSTSYYTIDFDWGLSSGEENFLRIFSWLFHVFPRDSTSHQIDHRIINYSQKSGKKDAVCDSVLLFMDEADLTFHPEWQRMLIHVLTAFLPSIYPPNCAKTLQVVLTTHSPLLLGDIPRENILFLFGNLKNKTGNPESRTETFGQNIHTILKNSFFLENGTVGEFAANRINSIATTLSNLQQNETENTDSFYTVSDDLEWIRKNINLVAPGILRSKLELLYQNVVLNKEESAQETIERVSQNLSWEEQYQLLLQWMKKLEDNKP